MKVAIIGSALTGNKGAAAMLESGVQQLTARRPDARFVLLSMYPRSDAAQNPYPQLRVLDAAPLRLGVVINGFALLHRLLPPLRGLIERSVPEIRALRSADVLLDQGGITFVDGRGKFLIYNVASILPALFLGTPVVKCAQAMGPFRSPLNRLAAKVLLPRMAAIVSRGAVTHEHLEGLGLTNITPGADLAFTLEISPADAQAAEDAVAPGFFGDGPVVGVSPSAVLHKAALAAGEDYVGEVRRMLDHLTSSGHKVLLVAHSARGATDKTHNNDLPLCREIYAGVQRPELVAFPDTELSSQALRALIGRCDLFVASRFHAMVSSLAQGVPTLVIGWSHKYREVLDMFGLAEWAMSRDGYSDAVFAERFAVLVEQQDALRAQIAASLPAVKEVALRQVDEIVAVAERRG